MSARYIWGTIALIQPVLQPTTPYTPDPTVINDLLTVAFCCTCSLSFRLINRPPVDWTDCMLSFCFFGLIIVMWWRRLFDLLSFVVFSLRRYLLWDQPYCPRSFVIFTKFVFCAGMVDNLMRMWPWSSLKHACQTGGFLSDRLKYFVDKQST